MTKKVTTNKIKKQIPNYITQEAIAEFKEVWSEMQEDVEEDIDIEKHMTNGKNWKRVHKAKCREEKITVRTFDLSPLDVFEGMFKLEVTTNLDDTEVLKTYFYNE